MRCYQRSSGFLPSLLLSFLCLSSSVSSVSFLPFLLSSSVFQAFVAPHLLVDACAAVDRYALRKTEKERMAQPLVADILRNERPALPLQIHHVAQLQKAPHERVVQGRHVVGYCY